MTRFQLTDTIEAMKTALPALSKRYTDEDLAQFVKQAVEEREHAKHLIGLTRAALELARLDFIHN